MVDRKRKEADLLVWEYAKRTPKSETMVAVMCEHCGEDTLKTLKYVERRDKEGKHEFYCDTTCSGLAHSERMAGEGNPNHGNVWVNHPSRGMTAEQLTAKAVKAWETSRRNGTDKERLDKLHGASKDFFSTEIGMVERQRISILGIKASKRKDTGIEIKMREELDARGIVYEKQFTVGRFVLDFFLPEYGIAIECDGDYWHRIPSVIEKDIRKNDAISNAGYTLFRFWEFEIDECVESCVDMVMTEINREEAKLIG